MTGTPAWHKLGRVLANALNSTEAIREAGLDWLVQKVPLTAELGGQALQVPGKFAVVREDTKAVFGAVGRVYHPLQNQEAFAFMDDLIGEELARYDTAGGLYDGRRVWMLARIPDLIRATGEDVVEPYALLTTTHDGSGAVQVLATSVRVVCQNTLNLALGQKHKGITIRHTTNMKSKVAEARKALGLVSERVRKFHAEVETLKQISLTTARAREYFLEVFPAPEGKTEGGVRPAIAATANILDAILDGQSARQELAGELLDGYRRETTRQEKNHAALLEQLMANFEGHPTNTLPGVAGTAWAAFNSVSYYTDHQMKVTGKSQLEMDSNRLNSIWFGKGDEAKQAAYQAALQLA